MNGGGPPAWVWACLIGGNLVALASMLLPDPGRVMFIALSGLLMGYGLREVVIHRRRGK